MGLWAWRCICRVIGCFERHIFRFAFAPYVPNISSTDWRFILGSDICQEREIAKCDTVSPAFNAHNQPAGYSFENRRTNGELTLQVSATDGRQSFVTFVNER